MHDGVTFLNKFGLTPDEMLVAVDLAKFLNVQAGVLLPPLMRVHDVPAHREIFLFRVAVALLMNQIELCVAAEPNKAMVNGQEQAPMRTVGMEEYSEMDPYEGRE